MATESQTADALQRRSGFRPAHLPNARAWCERNVVLTAPRSLAELEQNLDVLELPPMRKQKRGQWQRFGDLVYGAGKGAFETSWP
jgi:hypothetical protein